MSPRKQFVAYTWADFCPDHSSATPAITVKAGECELRLGDPERAHFRASGTPGTLSLRSGPTPGFNNNQLMPSHRRANII